MPDMHPEGDDTPDARKTAAETALAEWAAAWAAHRGGGPAHADAILSWAEPRDPEPAAAPDPAPRRTVADRVAEYQDRVTGVIERVKERRGLSLYEAFPQRAGRWDADHCGITGCGCSHGRFRSQGDYCDRGLVETPSGWRRCLRCGEAAAARAARGRADDV